MADATVGSSADKQTTRQDVEAAVEKLVSAKKSTLTERDKQLVQQALGPEDRAAIIDSCRERSKITSDVVSITSIAVSRRGPNDSKIGVASARIERKDHLGSCTSDELGRCTMQIVGDEKQVEFLVDHRSYFARGEVVFTREVLRQNKATISLEYRQIPDPVRIQVLRRGEIVRDGKVRLDGQLSDAGLFYRQGCTPSDKRECRSAQLNDGPVFFEHEADFKTLLIYFESGGRERSVREFKEGDVIPNLIDVEVEPQNVNVTVSPPTPELTSKPCGSPDLLYAAVAGFRGWNTAGRRNISATIEDGKIGSVSISPDAPELFQYLNGRRLKTPAGCTPTKVRTSFEAAK